MPIRQYAQRLLNPFRGVMNIIEYESAETVIIDGIHQDIYARDAELVDRQRFKPRHHLPV